MLAQHIHRPAFSKSFNPHFTSAPLKGLIHSELTQLLAKLCQL